MATRTTTQNSVDIKKQKSRKNSRGSVSSSPRRASTRKKPVPPGVTYSELLFEATPHPYNAPVPPYIWIDHPQQNEQLFATEYVLRLGVGGADLVELSIDNGEWQACRSTSGYWWYDWSNIAPGAHTLVARMKTGDGIWYRTPPRDITQNG